MKNINGYNSAEFAERFKKTTIYQSLSQEFNQVLFEHFIENFLRYNFTPRENFGTSSTSAVSFYYLEFLTAKNPKTIYDLGCGWNMFKKYIPNIVGVDAKYPNSDRFFADINNCVDDDYVKGHQEYFESVFSINALHFHPLSDLRKIATDFVSMIKPGGMGYLAVNLMRMLERDQEKFKDYTNVELDAYVRQQLNDLVIPIEYQVVDIDLSTEDSGMDGNIRFVVQRLL
jgi:hypothetical protein